MRPVGERHVATLAFDSTRYVGARIGIFDPSGRKVGRVGHLSNRELLVIAGEAELVKHVVEACGEAGVGEGIGNAGAATGAGPGLVQVQVQVRDQVRVRAGPGSARVGVGTADRLQQAT